MRPWAIAAMGPEAWSARHGAGSARTGDNPCQEHSEINNTTSRRDHRTQSYQRANAEITQQKTRLSTPSAPTYQEHIDIELINDE